MQIVIVLLISVNIGRSSKHLKIYSVTGCNFCNFLKKRFLYRLLKTEIKDIHFYIEFINNKFEKLKERIVNSSLDSNTIENFFNFSETKFLSIRNNQKEKYFNKLNFLMSKSHYTHKAQHLDESKWVVNLTKVNLPKDVIDIVSLGRKHSIPEVLTKKMLLTP